MTAAQITFLGSNTFVEEFDESGRHFGRREVPGPAFIEWRGLRFDVGKPVTLDPATVTGAERAIYEAMINKLRGNQYFTVEAANGVDKQELAAPPPPHAIRHEVAAPTQDHQEERAKPRRKK